MRAVLIACLLAAAPAAAQERADECIDASTSDRSTPCRAYRAFIVSAHEGDYREAAEVLDLSAIPSREQRARGPQLAQKLGAVLDQELWVDFASVRDNDEAGAETLGFVRLGRERVPIRLVRTSRGGRHAFVFSSETVAAIPDLYDHYGPGWIETRLPDAFKRGRLWEMQLWQWLGLLIALALGYVAGVIVGGAILRLFGRLAARTKTDWDDRLIALARSPTRLLLTLIVTWMLVELLHLAAPAQTAVNKLTLIALIGAVAWGVIRALDFFSERIVVRAERKANIDGAEENTIRGLRTQVLVLRRVLSIIAGVIAVAMMFMQFDAVRTVGESLLASAGVAGIVLGLAAQRSIATLLAGLQLSITRPIRIGDTVVIENENGTVEEINLTYVVVKLWDNRRLIVPTNKFLDTSFQNHTRVFSNEHLGHVVLHADYELPVDRVRAEYERILANNPAWDEKQKELVVTEATDRTIQLRALVTAASAKDLWALRCDVRERLIAFIQALDGGRYLPRTRVEDDDGGTIAAAVRDRAGN